MISFGIGIGVGWLGHRLKSSILGWLGRAGKKIETTIDKSCT